VTLMDRECLGRMPERYQARKGARAHLLVDSNIAHYYYPMDTAGESDKRRNWAGSEL